LYFELLEGEINDIFYVLSKRRKTALQLEIDQVGSGPTLIALATGNKILAEKCNLLEGSFCCIYTFLLDKSKSFMKEHMNMNIDEESFAYKLLTEDRKAQKYAIMCFFYNQQHLGRTKRWVDQYEDKFGISVTPDDYELLSRFSVKYPQFMEYVFPKITRQLDLLNEALFLVIDQGLPVKINTLDKSIISWDFYHTEELKKNYFNPISGKHDQYKFFWKT